MNIFNYDNKTEICNARFSVQILEPRAAEAEEARVHGD